MKTEMILQAIVHQDETYQKLLCESHTLEVEFQRIRTSLSADDQRILDRYISLGEEMDYRRLYLALRM